MLEEFSKGHYQTIAADPPWAFATYSKTRQTRSAEVHYDLMTLDDIKAMPVADIAAPNSVLLLWVTNPMLPEGLEVMKAWGFEFKTIGYVWAKTTPSTGQPWKLPSYHMGLGYWTRANSEICLLGTRGKPKRIAKDVRQLLVCPRREHSRKPDKFYSETERLLPGPYIELFSRTSRPGWDAFGNEVGKFNDNPAISDDVEDKYIQSTFSFIEGV